MSRIRYWVDCELKCSTNVTLKGAVGTIIFETILIPWQEVYGGNLQRVGYRVQELNLKRVDTFLHGLI